MNEIINEIDISNNEDKDFVECPELGYKQDLVNCYRCFYFGGEVIKKESNSLIIKCKFNIKEEMNDKKN